MEQSPRAGRHPVVAAAATREHATARQARPMPRLRAGAAALTALALGLAFTAGPAVATVKHRLAVQWHLARTPGALTRGQAPLPARDPSNSRPGVNPEVNLADVSCASVSFCVAVGDYEDSANDYTALIEVLSHGAWQAVAPAEPGNDPSGSGPGTDHGGHAFSILFAVSCASTTYCVAVGSYHDNAGQSWGLIETLSNGVWQGRAAPLPGKDPSGEMPSSNPEIVTLSGVDCAAPGSCVAVGAYPDAAHYDYGLIETLANGKWKADVAPQPARSAYGSPPGSDTNANQFAGVGSVSCPTPGFCVAVGYYKDANGYSSGLVDTYRKGKWQAGAAPEPSTDASGAPAFTSDKPGAYGALVDITCTALGRCTAVGSYRDATDHNYALVDTLASGRWQAAAAPEPGRDLSGAQPGNDTNKQADASLSAVDCPDGQCVTVGFYKDAHGNFTGLVEVQSKATWKPMVAPEPTIDSLGGGPGSDLSNEADTSLNSLSCISARVCMGVGTYNDAKGNSIGLIDVFSSGRWWALAAPAPIGRFQLGLTVRQAVTVTSVSCTGTGACTLVGSYQDSAGHTFGLIDSYGP